MSKSVSVRRVEPGAQAWPSVLAFIDAHADPIQDFLLHADVRSELGRLSSIWLAPGRALAFSFPLDPLRPSLGVKGVTAADEAAMANVLIAAGEWDTGYVICAGEQTPLWSERGTLGKAHGEVQMTLDPLAFTPQPADWRVRVGGFAEVDAFMNETHAAAWHPAQFETGPYVVAEEDGKIVAAAGTHFAYPELAQVGNVIVHPDARGSGLGTVCTNEIVKLLLAKGYPTLSLLVATDNAPAMAIYGKLGFKALRTMTAFPWDARP